MNRREELAERLQSSFRKIMHCTRATFRQDIAEYGVTWPQYHVLKMVAHLEHAKVTDISDGMMFSSPTASRMIDGLCKKELLEKRREESDQRITLLVLTLKGKSLMDRIGAIQREHLINLLGEEDDDNLENVVCQLERISQRWLSLLQEPMEKDSDE